jgi:hypothetical protein
MIRDGLLYRGEFVFFGIDPFYGHDMFSMGIGQRHETGRHGLVFNFFTMQVTDEQRTGTAIAFAAADLCAFEVLMVPHKIKHGHT